METAKTNEGERGNETGQGLESVSSEEGWNGIGSLLRSGFILSGKNICDCFLVANMTPRLDTQFFFVCLFLLLKNPSYRADQLL